MPVPMTKDQLIETLEVMIEHIRQGDSYEGNLQGQGGMRMIGELR